MRHPDGTALFDWDFYNITEEANFMLTEQKRVNSHLMIDREPIMSDVNTAILDAAEARMRLGGFNGFGFRDKHELPRQLGCDLGNGTLTTKLKNDRIESALCLPSKLERQRG